MLVKVSQKYAGLYGLHKEDTKSVTIKTRESAPFEEDDALSLRMISKGILEKAEEVAESEENTPDEAKKAADPEVKEENTDLEQEETGDEPLEKKTISELREIAKGYGITFKVGMSKDDLANAIREAESEEPPEMTAEEPE